MLYTSLVPTEVDWLGNEFSSTQDDFQWAVPKNVNTS